jgi:hypothetical protein
MIRGDWGGFYLLVGGPIVAALGWLVHPWGMQRTNRKITQRFAG